MNEILGQFLHATGLKISYWNYAGVSATDVNINKN
jgi:hypothetical protein